MAALALAALTVSVAGATTTAKPNHKRTYDGVFERKVSKKNKRWAKRVARCESGGNPNAVGGGGAYRGAFQFMRSTWRTAPRSPGGDPDRLQLQDAGLRGRPLEDARRHLALAELPLTRPGG
jgi:hypothetical protein